MIATLHREGPDLPGGTIDSWLGTKVYLVGIGGCGMRGAAAVLQAWGAEVCGSDAGSVASLGELVAGGAVVHLGHRPEQVPPDADLLVASAAIPGDNPELCRARQLGIPVITYAELIGLLMATRCGVAVAGTHGKSTTSALTAFMFRTAGLDPSFIVGAHCRQLNGGGGVGQGPHLIVESCEYARSFLYQRPQVAAILNIERDHLDCYADLDDIAQAFGRFAGNVPSDGVVIARHADPVMAMVLAQAAATVETFGLEPGGCWQATDIRAQRGYYRFTVRREGQALFSTTSLLAGVHNVLNAVAATALAWHGGADLGAIAEAIRTFEGIDRRMTVRGTGGGVTIIDDYAHHPTEIAATLRAIRDRYDNRRTWVVFQPHQYSRTRLLMDEFARCFTDADVVLVPDIYAARDSEEERRMTRSADLVSRLGAAGLQARYLPTLEEVTSHLVREVSSGDVVVTMGAGDVWKVADALVGRNLPGR